MGLKIYQWNGSKSGVFEKSKAGQLCRSIDSERSGKPEVIVVEQNSEDNEFWKALGDKGDIADASTVPNDDEWENSTEKNYSDSPIKVEPFLLLLLVKEAKFLNLLLIPMMSSFLMLVIISIVGLVQKHLKEKRNML